MSRPQPPSGSLVDSRVATAWPWLLALVFAACLAGIFFAPQRIHHDTAMYLQAGQLLLDGQAPYVDFIDLNPPLIMYLNVIPAWLARLAPFPPITTFALLVWLLAIVSTLALRRTLLDTFAPAERIQAETMGAAYAVFQLHMLAALNFGQREHLFVLAYAPFFVMRHRRWSGLPIAAGGAAARGALAGLLVCLKPHCLLIAAAPEIVWWWTRRRRRPLREVEMLAFAAVGLAYAGHFFLLPAAVRDAFFGRWLPFIADGYASFNAPAPEVLFSPWNLLTVALCVVAWRRPPQTPADASRLALPLAAVAAAASAAFVVQRKGWGYQQAPAIAAIELLIGLYLARRPGFQQFGAKTAARAGLAAATVVLGAAAAGLGANVATWAQRPVHDRDFPLRRAIAANSLAGDAVLIVSGAADPAYPALVQLARRPGSRYLWCFPIPMLYKDVEYRPGGFPYRDPASAPPAERRFLDELAADIRNRQPQLVFLDDGAHWPKKPERFDVNDYLTQNGFVADALRGYRPRAWPGGDMVMYVRDRTKGPR